MINKSYEQLEEIGRGAFGSVFKCREINSQQIYAMKVLLQESSIESVKRFKREVVNTASLKHPRIVQIVDYNLDEKPYWLVMPLYKMSLLNLFPKVVGDKKRIFKLFSAILDGVEFAHKNQIIHRDLKPGNILLNSDEDLVLSDFGVSKLRGAKESYVTSSGAWVGTEGYMAPEQLQNARETDHRADIYSLGKILQNLNIGLRMQNQEILEALSQELEEVMDVATRDLAHRRYQSVSELREAWIKAVMKKGIEEGLDQAQYRELRQKERLGKNWLIERFMGLCSLLKRTWDGEPYFREGSNADHIELVYFSSDVQYLVRFNLDDVIHVIDSEEIQVNLTQILETEINKLPKPVLKLPKLTVEDKEIRTQNAISWRTRRLRDINEKNTPIELKAGPKLAIHLYPLQCSDPEIPVPLNQKIDRDKLKEQKYLLVPTERIDDFEVKEVNSGLITSKTFAIDDTPQSYVHFFENGQIESVRVLWQNEEDQLFIYQVEEDILISVTRFLKALANVGVGVPIILTLSLLDVQNYGLKIPQVMELDSSRFEEQNILIDEVLIENWNVLTQEKVLGVLLASMFKQIWNRAGISYKGIYLEDGSPRNLPF